MERPTRPQSNRIATMRQETTATLKRKTSKQLTLMCKQKEAKEWIEAVTKLTLTEDLQSNLRDGVVLTKLLTAISPNLVKEFPATTNKIKMIANVGKIVAGLKEYGVKELFTPEELVNNTNMWNVIMSIHSLARLAARNGFTPVLQRLGNETVFKKPDEILIQKIGEENYTNFSDEVIVKGTRSAVPHEVPRIVDQTAVKEERKEETPKPKEIPAQIVSEPPQPKSVPVENKHDEQQEKERLEKEKQEKERLERERQEKERLERERQERERTERERQERERQERERLEKERQERERQERERQERERNERERLERERLEKEQQEKERLEKERQEKEKPAQVQQEKAQSQPETPLPHFSISFGAVTDPGTRYNGLNQDAFVCKIFQNSKIPSERVYLWGVFDGHSQLGEYASSISARGFLEFFDQETQKQWSDGGIFKPNRSVMERAFKYVNDKIIKFYDDVPPQYTYPVNDVDVTFNLKRVGNDAFYCNSELREERMLDFGTTAVVALLYKNVLLIGNAGDSEAVLAQIANNGQIRSSTLTEIHNCNNEDEVERIRKNYPDTEFSTDGYIIVTHNRINEYYLAMTKALGHKWLSKYGVSADPYVHKEILSENHAFLILASDGVMDELDEEALAQIVDEAAQRGKTAQEATEKVVKTALRLADEDDKDNTTALIIYFQSP